MHMKKLCDVYVCPNLCASKNIFIPPPFVGLWYVPPHPP